MDNNKIDPQYKGFKNWLKFCWSNNYIFLLGVGISLLTLFIFNIDTFDYSVLIILIPISMIILIIYKGMYQHWDDLRKNKSR